MLHTRSALSAPLLCAALLGACSSPSAPQEKIEALPRALTSAEQELIAAGEVFAFDFLREVARTENEAPNVFVSPLSASMALGMTLAGAEAETYAAMAGALRLADLDREQVGASYRALIDMLTGLDPAVRVAIGNSVWHRTGFDLEEAFVAEVERDFDARIAALDFADPSSADEINGWVNEATEGLIDRIVVPPIDPLTMVFLINAIYFDGSWTLRFDPDMTRSEDFRRPDGSTVSVPFMNMLDRSFPVAWSPDYQAIELPYGGEAFAMTIVLPAEGTDIDAFVEGLDAETWKAIVDGLSEGQVAVSLPKLRIEYEKVLNEALASLGMGPAFDPGVADFSRLHARALEMELHISTVKQKAFIEVDEEGTRAAAVTSVEIRTTSLPPTFRADRPFVFAIRERLSGTLLFIGVVRDPSAT